MKLIKVAVAVRQPDAVRVGRESSSRTSRPFEHARAAGVSVLCLPELAHHRLRLRGRVLHGPAFRPRLSVRALELLPETTGWSSTFGLPLYHQKALYNAAALLADGEIVGFVAKHFLAGDGIHYEPRWFKPWPAGEVDVRRAHRRTTVDADPDRRSRVRDRRRRIGFEICEDAWVANRPGADLALRGVDIICNPSASHFAFGKFGVASASSLEGSRAFGVALPLREPPRQRSRPRHLRRRWPHRLGWRAARARPAALVPRRRALTTASDRHRRQRARASAPRQPSPASRRREAQVVPHPFAVAGAQARGAPPAGAPRVGRSRNRRARRSSRARSRSASGTTCARADAQGYVISLSGGADSAACACLVALAVQIAFAELGPAASAAAPAVWRAIEPIENGGGGDGGDRRCSRARISRPRTRGARSRAARPSASRSAIGAEFHVLDIEPHVTATSRSSRRRSAAS